MLPSQTGTKQAQLWYKYRVLMARTWKKRKEGNDVENQGSAWLFLPSITRKLILLFFPFKLHKSISRFIQHLHIPKLYILGKHSYIPSVCLINDFDNPIHHVLYYKGLCGHFIFWISYGCFFTPAWTMNVLICSCAMMVLPYANHRSQNGCEQKQ